MPLDRAGTAARDDLAERRAQAGGLARAETRWSRSPAAPARRRCRLGEFIAKAIAPALSSRDLLVFDQRGTGESDPLSCPALAGSERSRARAARRCSNGCCARSSDPRAAATRRRNRSKTSRPSAQALRLRKARALRHLLRHEGRARVRRTLSPARRSAGARLGRADQRARNRSRSRPSRRSHRCSTSSARSAPAPASPSIRSATSRSLAAQLRKHPLSGAVVRRLGHTATPSRWARSSLLDILEAGDLNPALRALLPAAVVSALRHDPAPLLRLNLLSEGLIPNVPAQTAAAESAARRSTKRCSSTTTCEETPFPWQRAASAPDAPAPKRSPRCDALPALATSTRSTRPPRSTPASMPDCAALAGRLAAARRAGPLPNVPTLILSGEQDLRTPTADARSVAALIPRCAARGRPLHRPLGARQRLQRLRRAARSTRSSPALAVHAVRPDAGPLRADADHADASSPTSHPPPGLAGKAGPHADGRARHDPRPRPPGVGATLQAEQELPSGSSFGGLRGGYAATRRSPACVLHDFSFVPRRAAERRRSRSATASCRRPRSASPARRRAGDGPDRRRRRRVSGTLGGSRFDVRHRQGQARERGARATAARRPAWPLGSGSPLAALAPAAAARDATLSAVANALAQETSPYLRQHADNPVDWLPWGPAALERARASRTGRCSSRSATPPATGAT